MGMHREAGERWPLTPHQRELRRRIWWSLYCFDRFQNLGLCRPYVVSDIHCDVKRPTNINLADMPAEGTIPEPPLSQPSETTALILRIPLAKIAGEILDKCFAPVPPTYDIILELDKKLNQLDVDFPPELRILSPQLVVDHPHLNIQIQLCLMELYWVRTVLHRPYLLRSLPQPGQPDTYARSRLSAISFSKKLISIRRDLDPELPQHHKRFFLFGFFVFDACFNLCMAILQPDNLKRVAELDGWVKQGKELLSTMTNVNACAPGVEAIDTIRAKYLRRPISNGDGIYSCLEHF
ncbi:hypothetical protein BT69DRAFT_246109 [Atractiella rhizophila]|nr:hypothetical protein BT69DRAFT_246109 [Atractiella rhizophila]